MDYGYILQKCVNWKGQRLYHALSTFQSAHGLVKEIILQKDELVPEAYSQKFRILVQQHIRTHFEFPSEKENALLGG